MKIKHKVLISMTFVLACIFTTGSVLDRRVSLWYQSERVRFYQKKHYMRNFDVAGVHKNLNLIPENANVSAQTMLIPHLAFREQIYHYPYIGDAEYIVLLTADENKYPITLKEYDQYILNYKNSSEWRVFFEDKALLIFEKTSEVKKDNKIDKIK